MKNKIKNKIKNLIGLNKYPMGKHLYCYILDLTIEERKEFSNSSKNERLWLILSIIFFILCFFYVTNKITEAIK